MAGAAGRGYLANCAGFAVDKDVFCCAPLSELHRLSTGSSMIGDFGFVRSTANWIHNTNHVDVSESKAISGLIMPFAAQESFFSPLYSYRISWLGIIVCIREYE
jgi:hypothetical protein